MECGKSIVLLFSQVSSTPRNLPKVLCFPKTAEWGNPLMSGRHVCMVVKNRLSNDARVKKEMQALAGDGWQVTVIAMPEPGTPDEELLGGITILRPPIYSKKKQQLRERVAEVSRKTDPSLKSRIIRQVRQNPLRRFMADLQRDIPWEMKLRREAVRADADVYHANDLDTLEICALAAEKNGAKLVYDSHELWLESSKYLFRTNPLKQLRLKFIEKSYIGKADAVIAVTPLRARKMMDMYREMKKVHVIVNLPERIQPLPEKGLLRRKIDADKDTVLILYQGVLTTGRGLEQLLKAAEALKHKKVCFVFVGMDAMSGALQRIAEKMNLGNRVVFLPPVPSEELINYTVDADIGVILFGNVCLNNYYSLPNKLFEYMMAEVAIVSSAFPELSKVIESVNCGVTVDPNHIEGIVDAVVDLADSKDKRDSMASAGRAAALEKYNWTCQKSELINLYRDQVTG